MSGWFGITRFHFVISRQAINIEESMGFYVADDLAIEFYQRENFCWPWGGTIEINTAIAWCEGWS